MSEKNVSVNAIDTELIGKCFSNALTDVLSTMSGFLVSEQNDDKLEEQYNSKGIEGIMVLSGEKCSMVSISMSIENIALLVSYMTGISYDDLKEEDMYDGISELVNMLAGRAKILLSDTPYRFTLTSPFTISGQNRFYVHKKQTVKILKKFVSNELSIILKILYLN